MILALLQANKQEATRSNEASKAQLYWGGCRNPSLNKVGVGSSYKRNSEVSHYVDSDFLLPFDSDKYDYKKLSISPP